MLLGHRYYDPTLGRFLSRDPIKDGRNWYVYGHKQVVVPKPGDFLPEDNDIDKQAYELTPDQLKELERLTDEKVEGGLIWGTGIGLMSISPVGGLGIALMGGLRMGDAKREEAAIIEKAKVDAWNKTHERVRKMINGELEIPVAIPIEPWSWGTRSKPTPEGSDRSLPRSGRVGSPLYP